ncbi:MAG TPA: hypothetical protein VG942_16680 [Hyphomonadaceae bacterium]|nr:hypothetical protein [Hyphomonadaceae bacterium]
MRKRLFLALRIGVALAFAWIAVTVLAHEFGAMSWADVGSGIAHIGWGAAGLMVLATCGAFAGVSTYDNFALGYINRGIGYGRAALSSTTSYAVSNLLGFPVFTGNAVRFWLYESWGLGAMETAAAAVITTTATNLSLALLVGLSLLVSPELVTRITGLGAEWGVTAGVAMIAGAAGLLVAAGLAPGRRIYGVQIGKPGIPLVIQIPICCFDYVASAAVLYIPLAHALDMGFPAFFALVSVAKLIGIVSNVPGGLGVFEAIMATTMRAVPSADLAAALITFRLVFYLAPFAVAVAALARHGLALARRTAPRRPSTPSS